jgi:hypothetical protein
MMPYTKATAAIRTLIYKETDEFQLVLVESYATLLCWIVLFFILTCIIFKFKKHL